MKATLSRISTAAIAVVLAASLAGCSDDGGKDPLATPSSTKPVSTEPSNTPPPTVKPTTNPDTNTTEYCDRKADPFTGAVADQYGAKNVMDAYCEFVAFEFTKGFTNLMVPQSGRTVKNYSFVNDYLTTDAQALWKQAVEKYLAGDQSQYDTIFALTAHDIDLSKDGLAIAANGPSIVGGSFTPARTELVTEPGFEDAVDMYFDVSTNIVVTKDGVDSNDLFVIPFTKHVALRITPNGSKTIPWTIVGWNATWDSKPVRKYDPTKQD